MNDDRQAGRKEIGGGGEWTALREALTKLANEASGMLGLSGVRQAIGNTNMACLQLRVDEARALLEALAAAAPAPPAKWKVELLSAKGNWSDAVSPHFDTREAAQDRANELAVQSGLGVKFRVVAIPPQDGQGAELLGPPRGGSSSDLAGSSNLNVGVPPGCPKHKELMVLSFYDRPGSPPSNGWVCCSCVKERLAEREVATAPSNLNVGRAPKVGWVDSMAFDHELGYRPTNKIHATEKDCRAAHPCIEVCEEIQRESYTCRAMRVYVFDADAYDATKPNPTPTTGPHEAVAGNASAPVGEVQPRLLKVVEWLHMKMAAAQNLPYEDGDLCLECVDAVRDELMPLIERTLAGQRERIAIVLWELRSPAALRNWDTAAPWIKDYHYGQADAVLAVLAAPAPVGEKRQPSGVQHGPSCEFIKDGKGTCGPDCGQPSGVQQVPVQPSGVGEPRELADRITQYLSVGGLFNPELMDHSKVRDLLIECRDALIGKPREVGEGLREGDEVLLRAKISYIRFAGTNPRCARDFKLMVKDGDEEHVLFVTAAALAAPAPKPAPAAQPSCKCSALDGQGICNACADMLRQQVQRQREINAELVKPAPPAPPEPPRSLAASANWIQNVYEPWRRAAERKPPR